MTLDRYTPLPEKVKQELEKAELEMRVGDIFVSVEQGRSAEVVQICEIYEDKEYNQFKIKYRRAKDWEATEWGGVKEVSFSDFKYHFRNAVSIKEKSLAEWWQEARDVIEGKIDIALYSDKDTDSINTDNALMSRHSKEGLLSLQSYLEEKRTQAEMVRVFIGYEMEKKRQELENIRQKMYGIVAEFKKKVEKIMKVIATIELYLGINEELFQIQDGEKAPSNTPISFRQQVLYMDEEIGHWRSGGLDWTDIEWFDKWLTEPKNLHKILPEPKGMVVFRPRRNKKEYGDDAFYSAQMNEQNIFKTYLLIRNGDCLYRVYTDNIIILPRLFPQRKELQKLMDTVQKEMKAAEGWSNEDERKEKSKDKIDNMMFEYRKRAILMQGLIDRSEVFHPLPAERINIFNLDELGDKVRFIYDDEETLPSGRLSFEQWKNEVNGKIQAGSRVVITGEYGNLYYDKSHRYSGRWYRQGRGYKNLTYSMPLQGVYTVFSKMIETRDVLPHYTIESLEKKGRIVKKGEELEERYCLGYETHRGHYQPENKNIAIRTFEGSRTFKEPYIEAYKCTFLEEHLYIKYNPKGTVYTWDGDWHDRKNNVSFRIEMDDDFVLNYDQISIEDIDFYLNSRVDRPNYLEMMPILEIMKSWRENELKDEMQFARLLIDRNGDNPEVVKKVWESIDWWKLKNKWKRPIAKDDTLALRMIEKRINSKNYGSLKKLTAI